MLVIDRIRRRVRGTSSDDTGAVLVTVVIVMLVGFIIATVVAASVIFTVSSNADNRRQTQSFVAAESGRDVAVASLSTAIGDDTVDCSAVVMADESPTGVEPRYEYEIRTSEEDDRPTDWDTLSADCPTSDTEWVVVRSTGWGSDDAATTIDSTYPWYFGPATQPAGTLAYFSGAFKATKSTYQGDLVIREGDYECNNGANGSIEGDLWVLNGAMRSTSDCTVTGSIYTRSLIDLKNHGLEVGGDVISLTGTIYLTADNVKIGGDVYAGGNIDTKNGSGIVDGSFKAVGTMKNHDAADWERTDGTAVPELTSQPVPVITPTLDQVFDATNWIELTSTVPWSTDAEVYTGKCSSADLMGVMSSTGTKRALIDMTGCDASSINVIPGNTSLARDVLIYVPAGVQMDLQLTGTISKATGVTDPQLVIVHADGNGSDNKPTACSKADKFTAGTAIGVRTMIYSACGISNTMSLTMTGQLYMGTDGLHLNGGTFTCKPMEWEPAFSGLSCGVKGSGGIFDPSDTVTRLDDLDYQTEVVSGP
jgi:hypothetical protein